MGSECIKCCYCNKDAAGNQSGCLMNLLELVPEEYLSKKMYMQAEDGVEVSELMVSGHVIGINCPKFLTEEGASLIPEEHRENYFSQKNARYTDYFVFSLGGSQELFNKTLDSIAIQSPKARKISTIDCLASHNTLEWTKQYVQEHPGSFSYWSSHVPADPLYTVGDIYNSAFFYTVSNESVKINGTQKPPRPHDIAYCVSGYEWRDDFAATLQRRAETFRPFLAIYPERGLDGLSGLVINRKLYSMINSNKTESVINKLNLIPTAFPDQKVKMLFPFDEVFKV